MEEANSNKKQWQTKIEKLNSEMKKGNEEVEECRGQLAQRDVTKRNIQDNIKYRQQKSTIENIELKIKDLEKNIGAVVDMSGVEKNQEKLEKEYEDSKSKVRKKSFIF